MGEKLRVEGLAESELGPKLMPFTVTHTTDLKAAWFLSNRGGGCKNKTHFCHLCACTKDTLTSYSIGDLRCECCKWKNRIKCFHHTVCNRVNVESMLNELENQLGEYYRIHGKSCQQILSTSQLWVDHMQADRESDLKHIDYVIPVNDAEKKKVIHTIYFQRMPSSWSHIAWHASTLNTSQPVLKTLP